MTAIYRRLNRHLITFPFMLIEHKDGKVYLLKEHWRYLNPYKEAEKVCIGKGRVSLNQFEYITELFHVRTKFQANDN